MALSTDTSAPYAPSSAVLGILEKNRTTGLPVRIDKEVLERSGISESLVTRTLQALQVLDLINEDGTHTETLERLRLAPDAEYKSRMVEWLNAAYADILQYVDPSQGDEVAVRDALRPYKPQSMQDRMLTLFTGLFGAAGIWPESAQRARVEKKTSRSVPRAKLAKPAATKPKGQPPPPPPLTPPGMSEKALEYRLVDLMTEAASDPDVMQAIITVITYLKTKDAPSDPPKAIENRAGV